MRDVLSVPRQIWSRDLKPFMIMWYLFATHKNEQLELIKHLLITNLLKTSEQRVWPSRNSFVKCFTEWTVSCRPGGMLTYLGSDDTFVLRDLFVRFNSRLMNLKWPDPLFDTETELMCEYYRRDFMPRVTKLSWAPAHYSLHVLKLVETDFVVLSSKFTSSVCVSLHGSLNDMFYI